MTLKIDRFRTRVRLSGELRSEDLDQVKAEIDCCGTSVFWTLRKSIWSTLRVSVSLTRVRRTASRWSTARPTSKRGCSGSVKNKAIRKQRRNEDSHANQT